MAGRSIKGLKDIVSFNRTIINADPNKNGVTIKN